MLTARESVQATVQVPAESKAPLRAEPPAKPIEMVGTVEGSLAPAAGSGVQQAARTLPTETPPPTTAMISFRSGSDQLSDEARAQLTAVVQQLSRNRELAVGIFGYADRGSDDAAQRRRWSPRASPSRWRRTRRTTRASTSRARSNGR